MSLHINKDLPTKELHLRSTLEAVATTVWYQNTKITFCSLYLPPAVAFPKDEFIDLLSELPTPYLILGDFNCKNSLWGSPMVVAEPISYRRGTELLNIIEPQQIHILNTGKPTRVQINTQKYSHIDLSIGFPEITPCFNWDTEPDPHGSDHLPIIISHSFNNINTQKPARWDTENTSKSNWKKYHDSINLPLVANYANSTEACQAITEHTIDVAEQYVKKSLKRN